jgi:acid phosphatase
MKTVAPALALLLFACSTGPRLAPAPPVAKAAEVLSAQGLPIYDHIVIVIEENKDYDEIIGNRAAPFIAQLKAEGADLTKMYAEEHFSQGNYFWLFSGSNQNVGPDDKIPKVFFAKPNLGERLIAAGKSFKGYSEDLPKISSKVKIDGYYARKHVPWVSFSNLPDGATAAESSNLTFKDFPKDYAQLPTVSFVIPNLIHDMHDDAPGEPHSSIPNGSAWLQANLGDYYKWAKDHNSLLILTFDEDDHGSLASRGLTDPGSASLTRQNRIVTILAGAHIKPGEYDEGKGVTHVNLLRTLEAMYGLPKSGRQQPLAAKAGISDDAILRDVFTP